VQSQIACPTPATFEKLRHGQLTLPEVELAAMHLETCPRCVETVHDLHVEDTLAAYLDSEDAWRQPEIEQPVRELMLRLNDAVTGIDARDTPFSGTGTLRQGLEGAANPAGIPYPGYELGGHYRVRARLGAGGMGMVFLADDLSLDRPVALKFMLANLAAGADARQRFTREARAAAAVKHPHIVTIYQVGEDRGVPFLAMELLEGETLESKLNRERTLPLPELARVGREIAEGLAAAHARGLIRHGPSALSRRHAACHPLRVGLDHAAAASQSQP